MSKTSPLRHQRRSQEVVRVLRAACARSSRTRAACRGIARVYGGGKQRQTVASLRAFAEYSPLRRLLQTPRKQTGLDSCTAKRSCECVGWCGASCEHEFAGRLTPRPMRAAALQGVCRLYLRRSPGYARGASRPAVQARPFCAATRTATARPQQQHVRDTRSRIAAWTALTFMGCCLPVCALLFSGREDLGAFIATCASTSPPANPLGTAAHTFPALHTASDSEWG